MVFLFRVVIWGLFFWRGYCFRGMKVGWGRGRFLEGGV